MGPIERVAVIGAGNMGSGIAQKSAQEGFAVQMVDKEDGFVQRGMETINGFLDEAIQRRIFSEERVEGIISNISVGIGVDSIHDDTDLVIEAVFEDIDVKSSVLNDLALSCNRETIIATNTSSLSVEDLATLSDRPDRFIGLHFFYHPAKNRLVEIIPSSETSSETIQSVIQYCGAMGKVVILCKDRPGFVVNRFFVPWLNEACKLLDEGFGTPAEIDNVAKECFDIGMGPFELMNLTGPSIALHSTDYLASQLQVDRYKGANSLRRLVEEGIQWDLAGVSGEFSSKDRKEIQNRLLGVVFCIASQIVEEEICAMEDVDRGAKVGLRWPMGPFELANKLGVDVAHGIASDYAVLAGFESPIILSAQGSEPFEFKLIDLEVTSGVASITFNRPEAMNALNEEVISQLTELWKGLEAEPSVHTAILRGSGKAFVAGADIKFFVDKIEDNKIDDIREFTERGHDILNAIESSRINTIAVMSGLALGGGLELAMCCNHRIGVEGKTMLRFPETGIGIYPGLGGTQRSVMIAGVECARYSIIAGNWLDSNLAFSMGYLTDVVDYSGLEKAISDIANGKVDHPSHSYLPRNPEDILIKQIMEVYGDDWQSRLMGPSSELSPFEVRQSKFIGRNAPVSVKMASELIDIAYKSREDPTAGLQLELDGLDTIFSTKDALIGLKGVLSGERVQFSGE
tara:strand:- start:94401 stop:96461 length:2061 start_codon:yes stop_codon:yes gene_type:complete